jgi:hypothetical protein
MFGAATVATRSAYPTSFLNRGLASGYQEPCVRA